MIENYELQIPENEKLFFEYCDKIAFQKDMKYVEPLKMMLEEEKLNPCRIKATHHFSILNMAIMGKHKELFDILIKYANDDETPPELESSWSGVAYTHHSHYFKKMVGKGHFEGIKKQNPDGTSPLSKFIFKIGKKSFKANYENFFENEMIKFFLDKGANINTPCVNTVSPKQFLFYFLEDSFIVKNKEFGKCLNKALEYGFDINKPYDLLTDNNLIQYIFQNYPLYNDKDNTAPDNADYYLNIMLNHNYNFDYKNKMDETLLDIVIEKGNPVFIGKINALYEKFILNKDVAKNLISDQLFEKKKRI